jgi:hypothetical protein
MMVIPAGWGRGSHQQGVEEQMALPAGSSLPRKETERTQLWHPIPPSKLTNQIKSLEDKKVKLMSTHYMEGNIPSGGKIFFLTQHIINITNTNEPLATQQKLI